jgi:hypothetical protein
MNFNWTPEQVNRMDPEFINELMMRVEAENEHQEEISRKNSPKK